MIIHASIGPALGSSSTQAWVVLPIGLYMLGFLPFLVFGNSLAFWDESQILPCLLAIFWSKPRRRCISLEQPLARQRLSHRPSWRPRLAFPQGLQEVPYYISLNPNARPLAYIFISSSQITVQIQLWFRKASSEGPGTGASWALP